MKQLRILLALSAFFVPAALAAGCGGMPGDAVATVDGNAIDKASFTHWMNVAARTSGQTPAAVPDAPNYTRCVAAKRKAAAKPAKGQPKQTDAQLKSQCKEEYEGYRNRVLQLLVNARWLEGQADEMGIKVTDAEVKKSFEQKKKQSFPKEADYTKYLKTSGQTQDDILFQVRFELLQEKVVEKVSKGTDKVSAKQISDYYAKNKARFAQPEQRELRIVLTKTKAKAEQARKALADGQSWKSVAAEYSIDTQSKKQGGKLPAVSKGQQEKALDDAIFKASKGKLVGPVKTQFGYYDLVVTKITPASQQSLAQATPQIKQLLASQNRDKAIQRFAKDYEKRWREKTDCREGYNKITSCKNGPKATPTPSAAAPTPAQ